MSREAIGQTRAPSDPVALRALAHPTRLRLHALVGRAGTLTAADAARQLGISHALASHHLRQLAKYGFVEPAEAPDDRAHPWRVTATSRAFPQVDPEARTPASSLLYLTPDELGQVVQSWEELVRRWSLARPPGHADQRPGDAVPVSLTLVVAPLLPTEHGG